MRRAQWDLVLATPKESKERKEALESDTPILSLRRLGFHLFEGNKDNINDDIDFLLERVTPLTTDQGFNEWHLLRRFSLTSSTTHESIISIAHTIFPSNSERLSFYTVLEFVGKEDLLPATDKEDAVSVASAASADSSTASSDDLLLSDIERQAREIY